MSSLFMSNRAMDAFDDNDIPLTEFMSFECYIRFYMLRVINYCVSKTFYPDIHYAEFNEIDEEFLASPPTPGIEEVNKDITQILINMHELRKSLAATNSNKLLS